MKSFLSFFFLVVVVVMSVSSEEKVSDCPEICPALYAPLCAESNFGVKRGFSNACEMAATNCREKSSFAKVSEGQCTSFE